MILILIAGTLAGLSIGFTGISSHYSDGSTQDETDKGVAAIIVSLMIVLFSRGRLHFFETLGTLMYINTISMVVCKKQGGGDARN